MEDWEKRLEDFYFEREKILSDQRVGIDIDDLKEFIQQELDRAREEGRKAERDRIFRGLDSIDCIKEALPKNYSALGMQFGIYRAKEIVLEKELSKLTTK